MMIKLEVEMPSWYFKIKESTECQGILEYKDKISGLKVQI